MSQGYIGSNNVQCFIVFKFGSYNILARVVDQVTSMDLNIGGMPWI